MQNILTVADDLVTDHLNEEFEISELADLPTMSVSVFGTSAGFGGTVDPKESYKFSKILPTIGVNFTIMGYVKQSEFFVFSVMVRDEGVEMSPTRRAAFMELFNANPDGVKLRHVPVNPAAVSFPGAQIALDNGTSKADVIRFTQKALIELCDGISPLTGFPRKGLAFKSTTTNFTFKALSESYMEGIN